MVAGKQQLANEAAQKTYSDRSKEADLQIARDALRAMRSNALIPIENLKVTVSDGLVTLDGTVSSQFEMMMAEAAVSRLRGISGVLNRIEINLAKARALPRKQNGPTNQDAEAQNNSSALYAEMGQGEDG